MCRAVSHRSSKLRRGYARLQAGEETPLPPFGGVVVTVCPLQSRAAGVPDADAERPGLPDRDATHMATRVLADRDYRAHEVTSCEAADPLGSRQAQPGKPVSIGPRALVTAGPHRLGSQDRAGPRPDPGHLAHAGSMQGMGLRNAVLVPVE